MNRPPTNSYHQTETVFVGERQMFTDAGLSPDDPVVRGREAREKRLNGNSQSGRKKKPRRKN
jgi:hypothetical protein